ncbi:MAG: YcbK family protein [Rudaea sp.]
MLILPRRARANADARRLAFRHTHTQERLAITYAFGDRYVPDALGRVAHFLRDFRNGETHAIDPALLDQLHTLTRVTAGDATIDVISGYRSPATNRMLHERSDGVATHSLHLDGRAIDIRVAGVRLAELRDAALSLRAGGVGYYPASDFVHIDTGRVRRW